MRADPRARAAVLYAAAMSIQSQHLIAFPPTALHQIRGHTLSSIRTALDDPKRYVTDSMLVMVATVGVSELVQGQTDYYDIHMRGMAMIAGSRGLPMRQYLYTIVSWVKTTDPLQLSDIYRMWRSTDAAREY
jgi:hypothetical protein